MIYNHQFMEQFPDDLPVFQLWKYIPGIVRKNGTRGKDRKMPYHADGITPHSLRNPAVGLTKQVALARAAELGFNIGWRQDAPYVCVDIDNAFGPDGKPWPEIQALLDCFKGAFIEQSISGNGIHIIGKSSGPVYPKRIRESYGRPGVNLEYFAVPDFFVAHGTYIEGDLNVDLTAHVEWLMDVVFGRVERAKFDDAEADYFNVDEEKQGVIRWEIGNALESIPADKLDYNEWVALGINLASLEDVGLELWMEHSSRHLEYDEHECIEKWATFNGSRSDYRSVFSKAATYGWKNPRKGEHMRPEVLTGDDKFGVGIDLQASIAAYEQSKIKAIENRQERPFVDVYGFRLMHTLDELPDFKIQHTTKDKEGNDVVKSVPCPASASSSYDALEKLHTSYNLKFRYDAYHDKIFISDMERTHDLTEELTTNLGIIMEKRGFSDTRDGNRILGALKSLAKKNTFDSYTDYANALVWDGVERIKTFCLNAFGIEGEYGEAVSEHFWTTVAGRALVPGLKADEMYILTGPQGTGKSTFIRALSPDEGLVGEFSFAVPADERVRRMAGKAFIEIPEMDGFRHQQSTLLKAFLSATSDTITHKYQKMPTVYQRRCVFIGTTNETDLLEDQTGNRRYFILPIKFANNEWVRENREQLMAEAVALFKAHGRLWKRADALLAENQKGYSKSEGDDRIELVKDWMSLHVSVGHSNELAVWAGSTPGDIGATSAEVAHFALKIPLERVDRSAQHMVAGLLKAAGYAMKFSRRDKKVLKVYKKK